MSTELNINITGDGDNGPSDSTPGFDKETAGDAWLKLIGDNKEAMEALEKLGYTMSAATQAAMQSSIGVKGAPAPGVTGQTSGIEEEAKRRLERMEREKAIDQAMRAMDGEYASEKERLDAEYQRRREIRLSTQQERDEDYAARQERLDEKRAEAEYARQQKQEERDIRERSKQISVVPEAKLLHDDETYRRRVRELMADRERGERQKEIRREMDPEFAQQEADDENKKRARLLAMGGAAIGGSAGRMMGIASQVMGSPQAMQALGLSAPAASAGTAGATAGASAGASSAAAGAGAGAAGGGGAAAAGMAAGAAVPLVGIAIAIGEALKEEIDAMGERRRVAVRGGIDTSKAIISGDVDERSAAVVKGFDAVADSAKKTFPVLSAVTEPAKEFVHGVNEMRGAVKQTAERMAQYNGQLAGQVAMQGVTEIMRDISRANRNGGQMAITNESRFNAEQKLQDIGDRLLPLMLKMAEKTFNLLERFLTIVDEGIAMGLRVGDAMIAALQRLIHFASFTVTDGPEVLQDIRNLIRDMLAVGAGTGDADEWRRFLTLRDPAGAPATVTPLPPTPRPVVGMP